MFSLTVNSLRHFLLAVQFFTRIPVTGAVAGWVGFSPAMLQASTAYFPAMGWIVGGLSAAVFMVMGQILPPLAGAPWVAVILSIITSVLITGAFHEDGLADLMDGLGGSHDRERALDIMKDSRIGSYGAIALILALLAKTGLLVIMAQMDVKMAAWALFAAHVFSRFLPLFIVGTLSHVGNTARSKSKPIAEKISLGSFLVALVWTIAAIVVVMWVVPGLCWFSGIAAASAGMLWMWRWLKRRLGGFTGDALGATQQICEILFYLGVVVGGSYYPANFAPFIVS